MTNPFLQGQPAPAAPPQQQPPANPWPSQPPQQPAQNPPPQPPPWPPQDQQPPAAPQAQQPSPAAASAAQAGFSAPASTAAATDPFGVPAGQGDGSRIQDDLGQALLLRPLEYVPEMSTNIGTTDAVRVDWIVLTGPNQGAIRNNALVFNAPLLRDLKAVLVGPQPFLVAVLGQGQAKPGKSAPFIFGQPTDEHLVLARQAASANGWI